MTAMPMRRFSYRCAATDVLCVVILGLSTLLIYLLVPPFHRGFFCDDESIKYPVPAVQTVSDATVAVVSVCTPILVILVVEIIQEGPSSPASLTCFRWTPFMWMVNTYTHYGVFLFGAGFQQTLVEGAKRLVGRLRPHFYQACLPMEIDCLTGDIHEYIENYRCSGNADIINEARMSFPSGHASLSFYTATFLVMYLQSRMTWEGSNLLKHLLQFILISAAWVTALTRVSDYMHHWSDVLAGMTIGALFAVLTVIFISRFNKKRTRFDSTDLMLLMNKQTVGYNATENSNTNNDLC